MAPWYRPAIEFRTGDLARRRNDRACIYRVVYAEADDDHLIVNYLGRCTRNGFKPTTRGKTRLVKKHWYEPVERA